MGRKERYGDVVISWVDEVLEGILRRGALADDIFDVFFSYNSKDRDRVREIRQVLEARGVRVWMDERQIDPGDRWMEKLQEIIPKASASAIFLGPHGLGPWQKPEIEACIAQNVKRKMRVVPVPLPGWPEESELLPFLGSFSWINLRKGLAPEELDRLARALGAKEITPSPPPPTGSTGHPPRLHNLPFLPLGDLLKGRDEELQRLIANLQSPAQATAITQAIHGLGGIGKTRLAVEYAWRSGDRYDAVLFVVTDTPEALRSGLAGLARPGLLNLPEYKAGEEETTVESVLAWLRDHSRCLLILDNIDTVDAAKAVREILPRFGNGHVLITSRRRVWPPTIREQSLDELSREEGARFLLERTENKRTPAEDDAEQAMRLAEILGGLPLALEQTAAYIVHHQRSLSGYLEDWERQREKVLTWHDPAVLDYPASVAATWQTTFQRLSPKAAALLRLTAFLAPEPIPEAMFEEGEGIVEEATEAFQEETGQEAIERTVRDALAELAAYSMVTRSSGNFTVHRVVQAVLRTRLPESSRQEWIKFSLHLVNDYSPASPDDVRTWPIWDVLRPHAARVVEEADEVGIPEPTVRLMNLLAFLLLGKSLFVQAEPLMRRTLQISEAHFGTAHPNTATALNNVAQLFKATNRWAEAEPLMRKALAIDEAKDNSNVTRDLNNLARLLEDTNRVAEAEPLMRKALAIDEATFGKDHPKVSRHLNNLAQLLQATNRLAEAEPLIRRALDIDQDSFGTLHPNVARDLNNLAQLLQATNRLAEAEPLMRRALDIDQGSFGNLHPNVAIHLNNLAALLNATNRFAEAEPLMRRALDIDQGSFGNLHPNVARDLNNLAQLLQATNRLAEAEPFMRRALDIDEASLGTHHPDVARDLNNLASLLQATNRLAEAEPLMRRALAIFETSLGRDHPMTQIVRGNLKNLIVAMGHPTSLFQRLAQFPLGRKHRSRH